MRRVSNNDFDTACAFFVGGMFATIIIFGFIELTGGW